MAKKNIVISSGPFFIAPALIAIIFVSVSHGQPQSIETMRNQIIELADAHKLSDTDSAIGQLITNYSGDSQLSYNLYIIADSFAWRRIYDRSDRLYQIVIDKSSDNSLVVKAGLGQERNRAMQLISDKKYSAAQALTDSMSVTFKSEPDLATALFQIGQEFSWQRRYIEAGDAFNKGMALFPDSPASKEMKIWSARVEICALIGRLNIQQTTDDEIIAEIDKMITNFKGNAELPKALQWISKEYEWVKGTSEDRKDWFVKPNSVYLRLMQQSKDSPDGQQADWEQKRLSYRMKIFDFIKNNDQQSANAAIETMIAEFKGHTEIADELRWIAIGYEENPATMLKAKGLYDRIIRDYPGTDEAKKSMLDSRRIDIDALFKSNNDAEAGLLLEKFVQDFNSNDYAGPCLKSMAWGFRNEIIENNRLKQTDKARVYFERAIKIWNIIVDKLPANPSSTPESLYFIGETYSQMGECEKGIPYLKGVVTDWPDYQFAYRADTEIANCLGKTANK